MKKFIFTFLILSAFSNTAYAKKVFKIKAGQNYSKYSNADLKRRVWELERAVHQLQKKIYSLEAAPTQEVWVCTMSPFSRNYSATGSSKALAKANVIQKCTKGEENGFHCKNPTCEK